MAAQALVRESYKNPRETYEINVMGTVNLLDAARQVSSVKAILNVTTDKCYENKEWIWGYRENGPDGWVRPPTRIVKVALSWLLLHTEVRFSIQKSTINTVLRWHQHGQAMLLVEGTGQMTGLSLILSVQ